MAIQKKTYGDITADGNTATVILTSTLDRDATGFYIHLSGGFGGGTVKIQFLSEDGAWIDVSGGSFTAASDKLVLLPSNTSIRLNTAGSTTPTIYYQLSGAYSSSFNV